MTGLRGFAAVARLDAGEVWRSRWLLFCGGVFGTLAAIFVLVAMRESTLLGFTGMGRVLVSFCHALLLVLPLLALTATGQAINQARENGALELLFGHPFSRAAYYLAVTLVRFGALVIPLLALVLILAVTAGTVFSEIPPWRYVGRIAIVSTSLLWAFVGFGLLISTAVRSQMRAQTYCLLAYLAGVLLLDFALAGMMLQWRLPAEGVFLLASLNPVQAARMALLSSAEPELTVLGPVGFYLANRIGPQPLYLLGVAWPLLAGSLAWAVGLSQFRRNDLV